MGSLRETFGRHSPEKRGMAAFLPSFPPLRNRHSRLRGNPERYCLMMVLSTGNRGIPAYAGMTVLHAPSAFSGRRRFQPAAAIRGWSSRAAIIPPPVASPK